MTSMIDPASKPRVATVEEALAQIEMLDGRSKPEDLRRLIDALSEPMWLVRKAACARLGTMGSMVIEPLSAILTNGTEDQRFWSMKALVALGRDSVQTLISSLSKGDRTARIYAASALGEIGDERAIPSLVHALGDEVWRVRKNAYESLVAFGEAAFDALTVAIESSNEDTVFWAAKALGKLGERARSILLDALRKGSSHLRFILAAALGETGDERIVQVLINNLREGPWITQKRSADALAEIGPPAIGPMARALGKAAAPQDHWLMVALSRLRAPGLSMLEEVLVREGEAFRWDKKDALARIGDPLFPLYENLYRRPETDIRLFAVNCLGDLALSRQADDLLLKALSDPSWSIRKVAADRLAERGPSIVERLNLVLETGNEDLRFWVTCVFRKMGDLGISYLIKALSDPNKNVAYFAAASLGEVNSPEVVHPLIAALKDPFWPVRKNASEALVRLADFSVPALINFVNDEDEDIQYWVLKTLKAIGRPALPHIIHLLKKGSEEQRFFAAKALGMIKDEQSVDPLIEALSDGHEWVRLYAAMALGELGDRRSIKHLIACLSDPSFKVHSAIHKVFEKFGEAAIPELVQAIRSDDTTAVKNALRILGRFKSNQVFDEIKGFLLHSSDEVKISAVDALAGYDDHPEVVETLVGIFPTGSENVRIRIFSALGEIGSPESIVQMVKASLIVETEREKRQLPEQILRLGERAATVLVGQLGVDRVPIRKVAAGLLSRMGEKIRKTVETALTSEDRNVRYWATKIMKSLNDGQVIE